MTQPVSKVEVFRIDLTDPSLSTERSYALLGVAELQRAAKFRFSHDRKRYLARHVALRLILGKYLGCAPQEIVFSEGEFGKPVLAPGMLAPNLQFNLSCSSDLALIALTQSLPVGIDIERIEDLQGLLPLVFSQFTPAEAEAISALEPGARLAAFFNCWVRKEAVLKAAGQGLTYGLQGFAVSVEAQPTGTAITVILPGGAAWKLFDLPLAPNYAACVAAPYGDWTPIWRDFATCQIT